MPAALKRRFQPDAHNLERSFGGDHALPQRDDIGVIMLPAQPCGVGIPADRAPNSLEAIGHNGFTVSGAAKNDSPLEFMPRHCRRYRRNKNRVINRLFRTCSEVGHAVTQLFKKIADSFFVLKARMIRTDGNFHHSMPESVTALLFFQACRFANGRPGQACPDINSRAWRLPGVIAEFLLWLLGGWNVPLLNEMHRLCLRSQPLE